MHHMYKDCKIFQEYHVRNVHRFERGTTVLWISIAKSNQRTSCHLWQKCIGMLFLCCFPNFSIISLILMALAVLHRK